MTVNQGQQKKTRFMVDETADGDVSTGCENQPERAAKGKKPWSH